MPLNSEETVWFYHRERWSRMRRVRHHTQLQNSSTQTRCLHWRASLRRRYKRWCHLGPVSPPSNYSGVIATVYSYAGNEKAPEYLIKVAAISHDEIIYVEDFPDLLAVLDLLASLVSNGIFVDAYGQGPSRPE